MKAVIPVAGIGKRLRPHTFTVPKALLNVAGKPILGHIIDSLIDMGVKELIPIIGYKGDLIREYLDGAYDIPITYVVQEEQKGIAHAVSLTRELADNSELIIILGDTIIRTDFNKIPAAGEYVLGVREVEDKIRDEVNKRYKELDYKKKVKRFAKLRNFGGGISSRYTGANNRLDKWWFGFKPKGRGFLKYFMLMNP